MSFKSKTTKACEFNGEDEVNSRNIKGVYVYVYVYRGSGEEERFPETAKRNWSKTHATTELNPKSIFGYSSVFLFL